MATKTTQIEAWVIYRHPPDYPNSFVARKFLLSPPSLDLIVSDTAQDVRHIIASLPTRMLTRIEHGEFDDPAIVETWLCQI